MLTADLIKRIIVSQKEEYEETFGSQKIIPREIDSKKAKAYLSHPNALAILGARRCGKSTFAISLLSDTSFGYVNFDDERLIGLKPEDLDKVMEAFHDLYGDPQYLVFDEIQNVRGWELFINRLRRTKRVIITGSNSRMLSGELATHLTGRHIAVTLFPFSFREFLLYKSVRLEKDAVYSTRKVSEIKRLLQEYIEKGGFPECHRFGREMAKRIYGDITEKDIIGRHEIRYKRTFREILSYLANNVSAEMTFRKLANTFGIKDQHTVKNYLDYAFESYLFFTLERFSFKLKQRFISPKKMYLIDTGILNAVSLSSSKDRGKVIENLVAVELSRKRHYLTDELEIYYWKDHQQREVDFVVKNGKKVAQLLQVCYDPSDTATREREVRSLVRASDELRCGNLTVITWDHEGKEA
ncbi:MAG: ATP-binding protein, partial [Bacteroidota bacterium]